MKQFIHRVIAAPFVMFVFLTFAPICSAAAQDAFYYGYPSSYGVQTTQRMAYVNPPIGVQVPTHPMTPTQMRTGYTRSEIRAMPMVSRPNRPGHFIGNTVRRRAGVSN